MNRLTKDSVRNWPKIGSNTVVDRKSHPFIEMKSDLPLNSQDFVRFLWKITPQVPFWPRLNSFKFKMQLFIYLFWKPSWLICWRFNLVVVSEFLSGSTWIVWIWISKHQLCILPKRLNWLNSKFERKWTVIRANHW